MKKTKEKTPPVFMKYCVNSISQKRLPNNMVIISKYRLVRKTSGEIFSVVSEENVPCPCCTGKLFAIGSRIRKCVGSCAEKTNLRIRRLRCSCCQRIHHELPDLLVPYKRFCAVSVEAALHGGFTAAVAADNSTISRWLCWFAIFCTYAAQCLSALAFRHQLFQREAEASGPVSKLTRFVGDASGWLARVVQSIANANLWPYTRSAFLTGNG